MCNNFRDKYFIGYQLVEKPIHLLFFFNNIKYKNRY